jgi:hypothetical protein
LLPLIAGCCLLTLVADRWLLFLPLSLPLSSDADAGAGLEWQPPHGGGE